MHMTIYGIVIVTDIRAMLSVMENMIVLFLGCYYSSTWLDTFL